MISGKNDLRPVSKTMIAAACVVLAVGLMLAGCGSTRVYTADKNVQYRGTIYNVSEVKRLSSRLETVPASGEPLELTGSDRRRFDALVKEQGPVTVRSLIVLDDGEMLFEQKTLESGREFKRMQSDLADVFKKISRFMADAQKTQLRL